MLEAWYILRHKSGFNLSVENIYDQPLFKKPYILHFKPANCIPPLHLKFINVV
jgi:hypothetical protein